jgi:uncharacterized repeat protein (TIGR03803 family)
MTVFIAAFLVMDNGWATSTETVLYTFRGGRDGAVPYGGVILDSRGNLYGTTHYGGGGPCSDVNGNGCGTVFELALHAGTWSERVLHRFQGGNDGDRPWASLTRDAKGNLFGTTVFGGNQACTSGCGTVFQLVQNSGHWTEQVIYAFGGQVHDGVNPQASLVFDGQGNLYSTTYSGGGATGIFAGTVFELSPDGNGGGTETVLYNFPYFGAGGFPAAGVVLDRSGNLYGTTLGGGGVCPEDYCGTVYELAIVNGTWKERTLYQFKGYPDALWPYAGVILDRQGNLYGTTPPGGALCVDPGCGTVYELTRSGGTWSESIIHSFNGSDGLGPEFGNLIFDRSGHLYGTTSGGGTYGFGTVFQLTPILGGWQESVLYNFQGGADGGTPFAGVTLDSQGNLYGTTAGGGGGPCRGGCGVVFKIVP